MTVLDKRLERLATGKSRGTTDEAQTHGRGGGTAQADAGAGGGERLCGRLDLSEAEQKALGGFGLLSLKPLQRDQRGGRRRWLRLCRCTR